MGSLSRKLPFKTKPGRDRDETKADIQQHWFVGVGQYMDNLYGTCIASQIGGAT